MKKSGFRVGLIPDAFVYHKRRATFGQFFNQVSNFGKGRALIGIAHPEEVKLTHWFPTLFVTGMVIMVFLPFVSYTLFKIAMGCYTCYFLMVFLHALTVNKNMAVALLSVPAALLQLWGYGTGFFREWIKRS